MRGEMLLYKDVRWINTYPKNTLDPNFIKLFFAHQAVNNINDYRDVVLRTIYDFYIDGIIDKKTKKIIGERGHLVLNIKQSGKISAVDYLGFGHNFLKYLDEYFKAYDLPFEASELSLITNINSEGKLKLSSKQILGLIAGGMFLVFLVGGGGTFEAAGVSIDMETDGLIQSIIDYKNEKVKRDVIESFMSNSDSLKLEAPQDITKLIKELE